jgi:DNA polymerase elongation subunit (family B)
MINYSYLFMFDLETTSEFENFEEFSKNKPDGAKAFRLKYDRAQRKSNLEWQGTIDEAYLNNAPFLAEYGKLICISFGYYTNEGFKTATKSINDYSNEENFMTYVANLFKRVDEKKLFLSGHNIKGFDIPFLFKKMLQYGIKIPECLNTFNKKPWEIIVYDTGEITKSTGYVSSSLADVCYLLGLDSSKDDIDGSEVHGVYWKDKDVERICKYCAKDVVAVKEIMEKLYECM